MSAMHFRPYHQLRYGSLSLLLLLFLACRNTPSMSVRILEQKLLDSIPSGSGLVLRKSTAIIVGDDATGIYTYLPGTGGQQKFPIAGMDTLLYREPRAIKHDFEAVTVVPFAGKDFLLAFGSGSKRPFRDQLLMADADDLRDTRIYALDTFYNYLRGQSGTDSLQWNVEGAATIGEEIILMNRARNTLFVFPVQSFLEWITGHARALPQVRMAQVSLPKIGTREGRLSGACGLPDGRLLFCASVEDTDDWTKDGPVMGSFIGIYDLKKETLVSCHLLKDQLGTTLLEKIESVDLASSHADGRIEIYAVGDNDNGKSVFFRLELRP